MNKKALEDMIRLSQECLARFWRKDAEFVIGYFDRDILWIGSAQSQYAEGFAAAAADFRSIMTELKPCHISEQVFSVVGQEGRLCCIAGRYLTTMDDAAGDFLQVQQRCTFVWERTEQGPRLKHCHISNPMGALRLDEGERFPNALGETARRYWQRRLEQAQGDVRIVLRDGEDALHFFAPQELLYACADGRGCSVYTVEGEAVEARMNISAFRKAAGAGFYSVHRSYVVNGAYISRIQKYELVLCGGAKIPIPARRYKELRDRLAAQGAPS